MKTIYYVATTMLLLILLLGMKGEFGETAKWYSLAVFCVWAVQMAAKNWKEVKEVWSLLLK